MGSVFLITATTGTGIAIIAGADADSVAPSAWSPAMRKPANATTPMVTRAAREILKARMEKLLGVIRRLRRGAQDERRRSSFRRVASLASAFDKGVEDGDEDQRQQSRRDHAAEDGRAKRLPAGR